jgi:predicted dinucleotide-binding enzyme
VAGQPLDGLTAGNDQDARNTLVELADGGGLRGIDVGLLERSRQLQFTQNTNFASAWTFLV